MIACSPCSVSVTDCIQNWMTRISRKPTKYVFTHFQQLNFAEHGKRSMTSLLRHSKGSHWKIGCKAHRSLRRGFHQRPCAQPACRGDEPHQPRFLSFGPRHPCNIAAMAAQRPGMSRQLSHQWARSCCLTASRTHRTAEASLPMCLECSIQTFCAGESPFTVTAFMCLRKGEE